jgi:hypothetical protein
VNIVQPGPVPAPDIGINITARIAYNGQWLDLNDPYTGFELHNSTLSQATHPFHSNDVTSPYVQGTYSTGVQQDDVVETVAVWAFAPTTYGVLSRRATLLAAFSQPTFAMFWRIEDAAWMWDCRFASLARTTQQEFLHARRELLTFSVPRKPVDQLVLAAMTEL